MDREKWRLWQTTEHLFLPISTHRYATPLTAAMWGCWTSVARILDIYETPDF